MIIKTIINDDTTKAVKGRLVNTQKDFLNFITKRINNNSKYLKIREDKYVDLALKEEYDATVVCNKEDEFDENIGKKKVKYRCLDKYYKGFDKKLSDFIVDLLCTAINLIEYSYNNLGEEKTEYILDKVYKKTGYGISNIDAIIGELMNPIDDED